MPVQVKIAESPGEIARCFPVMKQLREKLTPETLESLVAVLGCPEEASGATWAWWCGSTSVDARATLVSVRG